MNEVNTKTRAAIFSAEKAQCETIYCLRWVTESTLKYNVKALLLSIVMYLLICNVWAFLTQGNTCTNDCLGCTY